MREKLEACFERLQGLNIRPTLENMEILVQVLYDLREIYNELGEDEENGRNGQETDPGGRDEH